MKDTGRLPGCPAGAFRMTAFATEKGTPFMTLSNSRSRIIVLCLIILLLTPLALQAQGISDVTVSTGSKHYVSVLVSLSGSSSHFRPQFS